MAEKTGAAAVVAEALDQAVDQAADQSDGPQVETLDGQGWLLDTPPARPRSPGRPKGARNKSSQQLLAAVQALGADPAMALVRLYSMDTLALAKKLGCEPLEAVREQRQAAVAVLPYVRSRAPAELNINSEALHLHLDAVAPGLDVTAGLVGAEPDDGVTLELSPMKGEQ